MKWSRTTVYVNGMPENVIAPIIISASRATDIPAGFADDFARWLAQGYCVWTNPFSGKQVCVSFANTRLFVFWTKNPRPFFKIIPLLQKANKGFYFSYTLNDYDTEKYERNLPKLDERIATFKNLSDKIGKERVLWRFDPLLLSNVLSADVLLQRIDALGRQLCSFTDGLIFSFIEIEKYRKVKNRLKQHAHFIREFTLDEKLCFAKELASIASGWKKINPDFTVRACAQDIDFAPYTIYPSKCIDDALIANLYPDDDVLMDFIGWENSLWGVTQIKQLKDPNQRRLCRCIPSKDIGVYGSCTNACIYCYAGFR